VIKFLKDKAYIFFLALFLISVAPFGARLFEKEEQLNVSNELFKPELIRLNTLDKLIAYTDSLYNLSGKTTFDTSYYVRTLSQTVKERFCHGTLDYKYSENWLAYLSGKLLWSHLSAVVKAEDILKHGKGLCSQQTIVLMEALRIKNISVRSVGLGYPQGPGHFLCEIKYGGSWHLHDVSVEPIWTKLENDHCSLDYYLTKRDSLFVAYESRLPKEIFYKLLERTTYGEINKIPAANMTLFHNATLFLVYAFPALFLFLFLRAYRRRSVITPAEIKAENEVKEEKESLIAF
jgi:hypothetical protein